MMHSTLESRNASYLNFGPLLLKAPQLLATSIPALTSISLSFIYGQEVYYSGLLPYLEVKCILENIHISSLDALHSLH
jgi:hypothetical protein